MIEEASKKCKHLESMPSQDSGEVDACCRVASELTNTMPRAETINFTYRTLQYIPTYSTLGTYHGKQTAFYYGYFNNWIINSKMIKLIGFTV